jgi:translation initiation factor IF-2
VRRSDSASRGRKKSAAKSEVASQAQRPRLESPNREADERAQREAQEKAKREEAIDGEGQGANADFERDEKRLEAGGKSPPWKRMKRRSGRRRRKAKARSRGKGHAPGGPGKRRERSSEAAAGPSVTPRRNKAIARKPEDKARREAKGSARSAKPEAKRE